MITVQEKLDSTQNIIQLLQTKEFDKNIQKSIIAKKYKHPTIVQSQLLEIFNKKQNIVIQAPFYSGKTSACLMIALQKAIQCKEQNKLYFFLFSSKDVCKKNENLFNEISFYVKKQINLEIVNLNDCDKYEKIMTKSYFILSTPKQFLKVYRDSKLDKNNIESIIIEEIDFCLSFGYEQDVIQICEYFFELQILKIITCTELNDEIVQLKKKLMNVSTTIKIQEEIDESKKISNESNYDLQQYYYIGDQDQKFIMFYLMFKLKFFSGKSIVLCKDINQVHKISLFFQRTKIDQSQIYNVKNPKRQKAYILSLFNTGIANIIISTFDFFQDLESYTIQVKNKEQQNVVKLLQNLIFFDFSIDVDYFSYLKLIKKGGCLFSLLDQNEQQQEHLGEIIENIKLNTKNLNICQFPIKKEEVSAFQYRISDVVRAISNKQIQNSIKIDFQKQLCKSKDLIEHYKKNPKEKEVLIEQIRSLQAQQNKYAIRLYEDIPDYLMPQFIKQHQKSQPESQNKIKKIIKQRFDENFETSLKKRLASNNLTMDDLKKKKCLNDNEKYLYINQEKEDPNFTSTDQLQTLSNRKLWKIKHKKSLKKTNKRLEKKGVFNS